MTDDELDLAYSTLCASLARVGPEQTPLFLSMLCLSLISRCEQADEVLPLIANAQALCAAADMHSACA